MFKHRQFFHVFYPGLLEGDNKPWPQSHEDRGNDQRCRFDLAGTPTLLEKEVAAWVYIYYIYYCYCFLSCLVCVCVKLCLSLWSLLLLILLLFVIISLFITAYYTYIYIIMYNYMWWSGCALYSNLRLYANACPVVATDLLPLNNILSSAWAVW